ncbi:hypothetical protein K7432_003890 [Basidiobolus ranarum]|uniref:protein-histidine N-methyltransferase n=1 Tax=Basidiobolus ranarum TaxID=34480 RepID=A0ABR2W5F4_9FUNG
MFRFDFVDDDDNVDQVNVEVIKPCEPSREISPDFILPLPTNLVVEPILFAQDLQPIYKRHLSDVKFQLAQEDQIENGERVNIVGLEDNSDLVAGIYEGGFKTWECSIDLVRYMSTQLSKDFFDDKKIFEIGCGSALPSLYCLVQHQTCTVHMQDYNEQVIRLITIPNVMVNTITRPQSDSELVNGLIELDIEDVDNNQVLQALSNRTQFFSGDWESLPTLLNLTEENKYDVLLTSETIYSVESHGKLYGLIKALLKRGGVAYVAAKSMYFGCDGSVLLFRQLVEREGQFKVTTVYTVEERVRREILALEWL